jgi:threonylcarbamoyladenosine tRNA methylthiotransferase MtaB
VSGYNIINFGCRATQADGAAIERQLAELGMAHRDIGAADLVVLNTCTVTANADADARAAIRKVHRENPAAKILVTGCYAQRAPEEIGKIEGVSWVVGNSHKPEIGKIVSSRLSAVGSQPGNEGIVPLAALTRAEAFIDDIFAHTELLAAPVFEGGAKTRPNLKVQDGCDNRCSFCVIPFVRGASRSLPLESVLHEVDALVRGGYREIVVSGINLGRWGRDFEDDSRFEDLLRTILDRTEIERIRISSVEPMDWSDELIQMVASEERICKHAHVPLQSGSDRVLRMMHRKYRPWHYAERIEKIHAAMPDAGIGADVMVGFPGETEEMFEETRAFIEALPFTYLHVFTFSSRPGTKAEKLPEHVPTPVAKERNRVLRDLIAEKNRAWRKRFLGLQIEAITLHANDDRTTEALSNNYVKVRVAGELPGNELVRLRVESLTEDGFLAGHVVPAAIDSERHAVPAAVAVG